MKRAIITFIFINISICVNLSFADDVSPPIWRYQPGSTYQKWLFDDANNPAFPDGVNNPFGQPVASITVGPFGEGWLDQLPGLGSKYGYWDLGGLGGIISLDIEDEASKDREIWIQVTYFQDISQPPTVSVPSAQFINIEKIKIEDVNTGGSWFVDKSVWRIDQGIELEPITITTNPNWGTVVDQVIVDTYSGSAFRIVDYDDLEKFAAQWLMTGSGLEADFNQNKIVDFQDFAVLANLWFEPAPADWPWW